MNEIKRTFGVYNEVMNCFKLGPGFYIGVYFGVMDYLKVGHVCDPVYNIYKYIYHKNAI